MPAAHSTPTLLASFHIRPQISAVLKTLGLTSCAALAFAIVLLAGRAAGQGVAPESGRAAPSGATWYVDAAAAVSGDGATPAKAVRTIPEGLALAQAGDTVLVATGVYTGADLSWPYTGMPRTIHVPAEVSLIGAGIGKSIIEGPPAVGALVGLAYMSRLEGFTIRSQGTQAAWIGVEIINGGATVQGNQIERTDVGVEAYCVSAGTACEPQVLIAFNRIAEIGTHGIQVEEGIAAAVRNNTIVSRAYGILLRSNTATVENNIISSKNSFGLYCAESGITLEHNNVQPGAYPYMGDCPWGATNTGYDPLLRNPAQLDYRLTGGSPLRGRGTGASDIGALPFVPAGQAPQTVTATSLSADKVRIDWSDTGAPGYDLFIADPGPVFTRRLAIQGSTSFVMTRSNPLVSPIVAVSAVDDLGGSSEIMTATQALPLVLTNMTVEQDSPYIWVGAGWTTNQGAQSSGGSYLSTSVPRSIIQFAFAGDSVVLGRKVGPGGGYAGVTIDGKSWGDLSFNFPEERWRAPAVLSGFGPGLHLLVLTTWAGSSAGEVNLDYVTTPSTFMPSAAQLAAVDRVNVYRSTAGLGLVRGDQAIHQAAQAHSQFYALNRSDPRMAGLGFHTEQSDLPGFTGKTPGARARFFGYLGRAGEDGHFVGDPIASVDGWMATVYHRNLILCYDCTDMGYGMVAEKDNKVDTLNMGSVNSSWPDARFIYTYPASGQKNVERSWNGGEIPDPLPGLPKPVGYPISIYLEQPRNVLAAAEGEISPVVRDAVTVQASSPQWSVTTAELRTAGGDEVPVYMLDQNTDIPKYLGPDVVFLIPHKPLAADTTYVAHIAGADSAGVLFDWRWAFSTGGTLTAPDFAPTRVWMNPLFPKAGDTVTVHMQFVNSGLRAEQVVARATLPAGVDYVAGSAAASQGSSGGSGPFTFDLGAIASGAPAEASFAFTVPAAAALPQMLQSQVVIQWSMGRLERTVTAVAGGAPLFLPAVRR